MSNDTPDLRGMAVAGALFVGLVSWAVIYAVFVAIQALVFMFWGIG